MQKKGSIPLKEFQKIGPCEIPERKRYKRGATEVNAESEGKRLCAAQKRNGMTKGSNASKPVGPIHLKERTQEETLAEKKTA